MAAGAFWSAGIDHRQPIRPSVCPTFRPPPGCRAFQGGDGGDDDGEKRNDELYSATSPGGSDAGDLRDAEVDDDMDGFIEEDITVEDKDDPVETKEKPLKYDPIIVPTSSSRIPRALNAPIKPSAEDVELHNITHAEYRNWCPICVESKGKEDPHRRGANDKDDGDKTGIPIVSLDYNEIEKDKVMAIVGKDEATGMPIHHRVKCKGTADEWVIKKIIRDLDDMGRRDVILKTDGEPAIVALQAKIAEGRAGRTIPRHPPAYNPQANGPCEKMVQDVTAQTRTLKLALEARIKYKIPMDAPVMEWLMEHAAFILSRYTTGSDGMTSYEKLTGRKWRRALVEFGEVVMAKPVTKVRSKGKTKAQKRKMMKRPV